VVEEEKGDGDGVGHIDEVAALFPVVEFFPMGPKERDFPLAANLVVSLVDQRAHRALMVLAGTIDVEVLQSGNPVEDPVFQGPEVELFFERP
jgi:hypothetical protein